MQTDERKLDVHADLREDADADAVFIKIIIDVKNYLPTYDITDVFLHPNDQPPTLGYVGKYHMVILLRNRSR